ncbi:MAG TPA: DUF2336 domain-containing protein [Xanthobacteraceae bacterium]|jgi:uncharacterized protein (DUF2336 family)
MIVRHFLQWMRTAPAAERGDATAALARAYLYSDLSPDDRAATEGALIMLLDDPSPLVRAELARALAFTEDAPPAVILGLAADQPEIASWVLEHSPLLLDADLVDAVATGSVQNQTAIANRSDLPRSVSAAIAEVGCAEACLVLIENPRAMIATLSFDRIVARHGHLGAIREAMLQRDDLPAAIRQALVAKLSRALADFVASRAWLGQDRALRVAQEACERATVTMAAVAPEEEIRPLIRHLRESGQLTAGLVLRALLSGNVEMFVEAVAELSRMPLGRVSALVHDRGGSGLRAVFERAGLPASTHPAFREAIEAMREGGFEAAGGARLKRRMVERVLTRCADQADVDTVPLLTLLRRFVAEAAREEARLFCQELSGDDDLVDPIYARAA